jgi:hypothetical protein
MKHKRLAKLNAKEESAWTFAFEFYVVQNKSNKVADRLAWRDVVKEFPRLAKYDGAKP